MRRQQRPLLQPLIEPRAEHDAADGGQHRGEQDEEW